MVGQLDWRERSGRLRKLRKARGWTLRDVARVLGVSVTPPNFALPAGLDQQCRALAVFADGTSADVTAQADWTSDKPGVATHAARDQL